MKRNALTLALALACAAPLLASTDVAAKAAQPASHAAADLRFLDKTDEGNAKELAAASLAAQRATSTAVRDYANKLLTDHQAMHGKLVATATEVGVTLTDHDTGIAKADSIKADQGMTSTERGGGSASTMAKPEDPQLRALSNRQGAEFDNTFAKQMVADHKKVIADFTRASTDTHLSPSVRTLASDSLPTLREHLASAQALLAAK